MAAPASDYTLPFTIPITDLCNDCKAIPFLSMLNELHPATIEPFHSRSVSQVYKASFSSLQTSVDCGLCCEISAQLVKEIERVFQLDPLDFKDTPVTVRLCTTGNLYETRAIHNCQLLMGYISAMFCCHLAGMKITGRPPAALFDICVPADSVWRKHIPGRLLKWHATPEDLIAIARQWLAECDARGCARWSQLHSICQRPVGSLPSRILDIGPPLKLDEIRLLEQMSDVIAPYVALSHCWGPSLAFVTTNKNLTERKGGIKLEQMPQTFRDAILVTRLMGIRYLWIDSLCILQDDEGDWLRESVHMGTVYSGAYFVIGAARAAADTEGFLSPREPPRFQFAVKIPSSSGKQEVLFLVPSRSLSGWLRYGDRYSTAEPLSTRAWTFQERHLARRTLFFNTDHMFWECQALIADESGERIPREDNILGIAKGVYSTPPVEKRISESLSCTQFVREKRFTSWNTLISGYLGMNLTKESDRLPALTGLATTIGDITGDTYIAGIWLHDLDIGLLWARELYDFDTPDSVPLLRRPKAYRAPSWSWAAVDGPRDFLTDFTSSDSVLFSYQSHQIQNEGSRYGPVNSGFLQLRGPVFPITGSIGQSPNSREIYSVTDRDGEFTHFFCAYEQLVVVTINGLAIHIAATFDFPSEEKKGLFVLFMVKQDDHTSRPVHCGLIIRLAGQSPEVYERVGMVNGTFMHAPVVSKNPATFSIAQLPSLYAELRYQRYPAYTPAFSVPPEIYLVAPDLQSYEASVTLI